uniref:BACK domain-containing protein n=1 Tax=Macrostomum lignano TaxID=282301 RepID=A0A1I8J447_9PLAT
MGSTQSMIAMRSSARQGQLTVLNKLVGYLSNISLKNFACRESATIANKRNYLNISVDKLLTVLTDNELREAFCYVAAKTAFYTDRLEDASKLVEAICNPSLHHKCCMQITRCENFYQLMTAEVAEHQLKRIEHSTVVRWWPFEQQRGVKLKQAKSLSHLNAELIKKRRYSAQSHEVRCRRCQSIVEAYRRFEYQKFCLTSG